MNEAGFGTLRNLSGCSVLSHSLNRAYLAAANASAQICSLRLQSRICWERYRNFGVHKMDYKKYYYLEEYLFNEVNSAFHKRGFLTAEDFFLHNYLEG